MTSAWKNRVFIMPRESVVVTKDRLVPMHILNNGPVRLAFKLKSTQSQNVKPNVSTGFLAANGGCQHILFTYKPPSGKSIGSSDRITILVADAPEGNVNWEQVGPNKDRCVRYVVKLREKGGKSSPKSKSESTTTESSSGKSGKTSGEKTGAKSSTATESKKKSDKEKEKSKDSSEKEDDDEDED